METKYLNIVEKNGIEVVIPKKNSVVILPFITDENNLPKFLGVIEENNPFRFSGKLITLITGQHDDQDNDYFTTAKRELKEESGYEVNDIEKWTYLGNITTSKFVDQEQPCFAVNVTNVEKNEPEGDGSIQEELANFKILPISEAIAGTDCYISFCFLRLFKFTMNIDVQEESGEFNLDKYRNNN